MNDSKHLLASNAYRLFVTELNTQLIEFSKIVTPLNKISEDERKALKMIFHKIKGGSGFFGQDRLKILSGELEEIFSNSQTPDFEKVAALGKEVLEISKTLDVHTKTNEP